MCVVKHSSHQHSYCPLICNILVVLILLAYRVVDVELSAQIMTQQFELLFEAPTRQSVTQVCVCACVCVHVFIFQSVTQVCVCACVCSHFRVSHRYVCVCVCVCVFVIVRV
jgi:hypothetical protein